MNVALVGCGRIKALRPTAARALYTQSDVFNGRVRWAEKNCHEWWVLSGAKGLVHPNTIIEPYEVDLKRVRMAYRQAWAAIVLNQLDNLYFTAYMDLTFHIMAGEFYWGYGLQRGLSERGAKVMLPEEGLTYFQLRSRYTSPKWGGHA